MGSVNGMNLPVLSFYPPSFAAGRWTKLGSAGGFSGARIWQGDLPDGRRFALKQFPIGTDAEHLQQVHRWMLAANAAGLEFVPSVERRRDGETVAAGEGRLWEITTWMPGQADFHEHPTDVKLIAAISAVARIHEAWATISQRIAPCPAIRRRWRALCDWQELLESGWRPRFESGDPIAPHAEAAWNVLPPRVATMRQVLLPWLDRQLQLQPCLGDVWHDHILFEGDRVSGIIDFAAAKVDHVAADLARLLGSLVPDQPERTELAIREYSAIRPLANPELIPLLDRAGVVGSIANWLRRLYHDHEPVADRNAVASRLAGLVRRL
jgi:Ser/Thr protein kinase RdoA (MazF antagonist)